MKKLEKLYDAFTTDERVKLALAAMGRSDEAELERLWATCPRKNYRMPDAAFNEKMDALLLIAKSVLSYLLLIEKNIRTALLIKEYHIAIEAAFIKGVNHGWKQAGKKGVLCEEDETADTEKELPEILRSQHDKAVSELKGYHAALEKFCSEIGIDVDMIISSEPIVRDAYDRLSPYLKEDIPANQDVMNTMYNAFRENLPQLNNGMTA